MLEIGQAGMALQEAHVHVLRESDSQPLQGWAHHRRQIGAGNGGLGPRQRSDLSGDLMREAHLTETCLPEYPPGDLLVLRVRVSVEENDGRRVETLTAQPFRRASHLVHVHGNANRPIGENALVDLLDALSQGTRLDYPQCEQVRPLLRANGQQVRESPRHEERHRLAAPLQQGVGRDGCTETQRGNRARID